MATEKGRILNTAMEHVNHGVSVGDKTAETMNSTGGTLHALADYMDDVKRSSDEQLGALSKIVHGLRDVVTVAKRNNDHVAANATAASNLE